MKTLILLQVFIFALIDIAFSQKHIEDFEIRIPEQKLPNCLYKTIKFIDSREDTSNLGIVLEDHGFSDSRTPVIAKTPLSLQLTNFLNFLTDSTAKNGELLFQIRKFNFVQTSRAAWSKRYCFIRAELYSRQNEKYKKLAFIDTAMYNAGMNGTRNILKNANTTIANFFFNSLSAGEANSDYYYTLSDISKIDSIEKTKIFVYNTAKYSDGLYSSYQSFMSQVPDKQINVKLNGKEISSVNTTNGNGELTSVSTKEIYAIVYQGRPYISTDYGYFPLEKMNGEFVFKGKGKATSRDITPAAFGFGIIGVLLSSNVTATFEMQIDHVNGKIITLRQIKDDVE